MHHRETKRAVSERAVVETAVILFPRCFAGVLVKVLRAHMMMLPFDHPAKAGEIAFGLIGANAVQAVGNRVIDALRVETGVQHVPMRSFVGMDTGGHIGALVGVEHAVSLVANHKGQRAAFALTKGDNDTALAGLVLR